MKIFYKNSYKLINGITSCLDCPFSRSYFCVHSGTWFHCGRSRLILDETQIFDL